MILDAETLEPVGAVDVLVREAAELDLPGTLKTELHASVVELTRTSAPTSTRRSPRCASCARRPTDRRARTASSIAAAGAHPTAPLESLPVVQEERYLEMIERVGHAARRQGVNGLHVHVGVESAERCYERLEAVLAVAARRARALGELAVRRRRDDRDALEPRRHPRRAAARRRAAGVRARTPRGRRGSSGSSRSA